MASIAEERLLTTEDAARLFRVSSWTIRRWVAEGRLLAVRVTDEGPLRFRPADLDALIERARGEAA